MRFKMFLILIFVAILLLFSIQNSDLTTIKILFWQFSVPLVIAIIISFLIGILAGFLLLSSVPEKKSNKEKEEL